MEDKLLIEELESFKLPAWNEIPDVGLYLDQVTKYINSFLDAYGMGVTPSMISNYVKLRIISREGKKIYSRERIASLFFVAITKTVLSMDQIRDIISNLGAKETPEEQYTKLVTLLKKYLEQLTRGASVPMPINGETAAVEEMVTVAVAYKIYLDTYFRNHHTVNQ